ncbi:MAG TPA: hypothetical protein VGL40_15260 [Bacillota bacterium]|jgi:hypothetical protein
MNEERLQILKMIESGKITAEEGAKLLTAVETGQGEEQTPHSAKFLKVKVYDTRSGKAKVNVNLPLNLLDIAVRFIPKDHEYTKGLDMVGLVEAIRGGAVGKIVEVDDEEEHQHVEVYVE